MLSLIFSQFLQFVHFTFHIDKISQLLDNFADIIFVYVQRSNILHQLMKTVLIIPYLF